MRLKGRQGRFLVATIGGWIAARVWLLWPAAPVAIGGAVMTATSLGGASAPRFSAEPPFVAARPAAGHVQMARTDRLPLPPAIGIRRDRSSSPLLDIAGATIPLSAPTKVASVDRSLVPPAVALPRDRSKRAIEGQAYVFLRPGSGRAALAPGGSLGASQVAARVAVALDRTGPVRIALAARFYAPLRSSGAETAVGLDWHPLAGMPLRVSVERRIGLDGAGRDAWSAYAAGGFYAGRLPLRLEADGYVQAGVVGIRSRDLFADGAVRVGRRLAVGPLQAVVGAGAWAAAQPGATRLDVGPRIAMSLPVERHRLTLAIEGRLHVAGHAAPGSGAVLTLVADL